ncbi:hypothetical protein SD70_23215 [Gordoniibacillus kamchatkensis]|uniref:Uncharacterized protein n=1 Tax=Gordoniibacillus kamchatkensis TaxID=1590651 RepID=A0ABR5ADD4_9BACL|nr:hypothetical protein SD70_23215 [Paenibacillus sp. VKM B-2647]
MINGWTIFFNAAQSLIRLPAGSLHDYKLFNIHPFNDVMFIKLRRLNPCKLIRISYNEDSGKLSTLQLYKNGDGRPNE